MSLSDYQSKPGNFSTRIFARVTPQQKKAIKQIVKKNSEKYFNESHFFRVAVIKLIREEQFKGGKNDIRKSN